MITSKLDLAAKQRTYARAGFRYMGVRVNAEGVRYHVWEKAPDAAPKKRPAPPKRRRV